MTSVESLLMLGRVNSVSIYNFLQINFLVNTVEYSDGSGTTEQGSPDNCRGVGIYPNKTSKSCSSMFGSSIYEV